MIGKGCVIGGSVWLTSSVPPGTRVTLPNDQLRIETRAVRPFKMTLRARLTLSVERRRASARNRATVFPVPGTTRRGATSASGTRTKRRLVMRGCGTVRRRVAIRSVSVEEKVEVQRARARFVVRLAFGQRRFRILLEG